MTMMLHGNEEEFAWFLFSALTRGMAQKSSVEAGREAKKENQTTKHQAKKKIERKGFEEAEKGNGKRKSTWDSNVVPNRSTNQARHCLTSLSGREAVLSVWYGPS